VPAEVDLLHLFVRYLYALGVVLLAQPSTDAQTGCGACVADEVQDSFVVDERLGCPVVADAAEHAMLDGIPLGGAGRVVTDFDVQTEAVAESNLKLIFPQAGPISITSAAVSQDEEAIRIRILLGAELCPPGANRIHSELRRVAGGSDADQTVVT